MNISIAILAREGRVGTMFGLMVLMGSPELLMTSETGTAKLDSRFSKGFTLIELLVVIAIIGILMGMVGPKVFDLLTGSKVKKTQSIFRSWVTQLYQYKEHYKRDK